MAETAQKTGVNKITGSIYGIAGVVITLVVIAWLIAWASGSNTSQKGDAGTTQAPAAQTTSVRQGNDSATTRRASLQAQTTCPPFSREGATCEVTPSCSGWIRPVAGSTSDVVFEWNPSSHAAADFQSTYHKIRYLDARGVAREWTPSNDIGRTPVIAWEFCPKQTIMMNYSLATPRS